MGGYPSIKLLITMWSALGVTMGPHPHNRINIPKVTSLLPQVKKPL
jgi:hypothetical protein